MASGSPPFSEAEIVTKELLSGGVAGSIGVFFGLPMDIVKVRMQTMPWKYPSAIDCFMSAVRQDGWLSLFRGGPAPIVANVLINAVVFATDGIVMRILEPKNRRKQDQKPINHIISGMVGGFTQCFVLVPFETVKVVMQVDGKAEGKGSAPARRQYSGTVDCAVKIFNKEGARGLYKGFVVTAMREIPSISVYFTSYKWTSKQINHNAPFLGETTSTALAGAVAGICSWLFVYPIDVVKTYIQTSELKGTSTTRVVADLARTRGWQYFFKGLSPTLFRAAPVNAITFLCYEEFRSMSGL